MELKKWNITDTPEITIPEMNDNLDAIENALKVAELDNLIVNGDFSDGVNGWSATNANLSNEDGMMVVSKENNEWSIIDNKAGTTIISNEFQYVHVIIEKSTIKPVISIGNGGQLEILVSETPKSYSFIGKRGNRTSFEIVTNQVGSFTVNSYFALNLTQTFGAGNEPSKDFCDAIMEVVGWFDGKYNLTIQQMFIIIAKWSQAQNTNQIMTLPNFESE